MEDRMDDLSMAEIVPAVEALQRWMDSQGLNNGQRLLVMCISLVELAAGAPFRDKVKKMLHEMIDENL